MRVPADSAAFSSSLSSVGDVHLVSSTPTEEEPRMRRSTSIDAAAHRRSAALLLAACASRAATHRHDARRGQPQPRATDASARRPPPTEAPVSDRAAGPGRVATHPATSPTTPRSSRTVEGRRVHDHGPRGLGAHHDRHDSVTFTDKLNTVWSSWQPAASAPTRREREEERRAGARAHATRAFKLVERDRGHAPGRARGADPVPGQQRPEPGHRQAVPARRPALRALPQRHARSHLTLLRRSAPTTSTRGASCTESFKWA